MGENTQYCSLVSLGEQRVARRTRSDADGSARRSSFISFREDPDDLTANEPSAGDGAEVVFQPWCFAPTRDTIKERYKWLGEQGYRMNMNPAFYNSGTVEGRVWNRENAPRLQYFPRGACRNHHWGLLLGCTPTQISLTSRVRVIRRINQLVEHDRKSSDGSVKKIDVYEDSSGDSAFLAHSYSLMFI